MNNTIRPLYLSEYVGQERLKNNLSIYITAAKNRNETLDHILLYGPPGLGKTTLANIIANEMSGNIKSISGPTLKHINEIITVLSTIQPGDILFIDEIHEIPLPIEEILYSAMEDFIISIVVGKEMSAKKIDIPIAPFTLIGATTRIGDLSKPFLDRFGIKLALNMYTLAEIEEIISRSAKILNCCLSREAKEVIANNSRGTPRIANLILRRIRDHSSYYKKEVVDADFVFKTLKRIDINHLGLESNDIKYLKTLKEYFNGGPVGVSSLASALSENEKTVIYLIEPFLLQLGFIIKKTCGRVLTEKGELYYNTNIRSKG